MKTKIEKIIREELQPVLGSHGGGLKPVEISDDKIVKISLTGTCSTCPGRQQTIEQFVEVTLKEALPEVKGVSLQNQVDEDLITQALGIIRRDR